MCGRAKRPAARPPSTPTLGNGGFTFAEAPTIAFPHARIIWRAELDPEALTVDVVSIGPDHTDRIDPDLLRRYLFLARDEDGREHVVLSDGQHRIRLEVAHGSLAGSGPVTFRFSLFGTTSAEPKVKPLVRLFDLCRRGRFTAGMFPIEPKTERWIALLRVHDALADGASPRDIAVALFGRDPTIDAVETGSDSLRSRVRRLIRDARAMAQGGYRTLLHERERVRRAKRRQPRKLR